MTPASLPGPTPRLCFREVMPGDAPWLAAAWADPAYTALLCEARPGSAPEVEAMFRDRAARGEVDVVMVARADGGAVGRGSLQGIDVAARAAEVELEIPDAELRRQGLGREALHALVAHAFGPLGLVRLRALVAASNGASLALGRAMGFRLVRRELPLPGRAPVHVLELRRG